MSQIDRINGLVGSIAVKAPVRVAATANITLSGFQTIDGITLAAGDVNLRVLVKNQTNPIDNGIWNASSGSWTRAADFDGDRDAVIGTQVLVQSGTENGGGSWRVASIGTIGTDAITFVKGIYNWETVATISDLRLSDVGAAGSSKQVLGYYAAGDGGGGPTRIGKVAPVGGLIDNGGNIIKPGGAVGDAIAEGALYWGWESAVHVDAKWYGARGGANDDTSVIQAVFDAAEPVLLSENFSVTSVTYSADGGYVDFCGNSLVGISSVATNCVLLIKSMHSKLIDVRVTATTLPGTIGGAYINDNYSCGVQWWNSTGATQYNIVEGLFVYYIRHGFIYGNFSGGANPGSSGAHSENSVSGFRVRGVQNPFLANAPFGVLTLVAPQFVNLDNEWSGSSVFNWNDSRAYVNESCIITVLGGELQSGATDPGYPTPQHPPYCAAIKNTRFIGTRVETAPTVLITGDGAVFANCEIQNLQGALVDTFTIDSGIAEGVFELSGCNVFRTAGVGAFSNTRLIAHASSPNFISNVHDCSVEEYLWPLVTYSATSTFSNVMYLNTAGGFRANLNDATTNLIAAKGIDTIGYDTATWYLQAFGAGVETLTISADQPPFGNLASSFLLTTDAELHATTTDPTSAATIRATAFIVKPGEVFTVAAHMKKGLNNSQGRVVLNEFDATATAISATTVIPFSSVTTSWATHTGIYVVPAGVAYIGISVESVISGGQSTVYFADVSLKDASL